MTIVGGACYGRDVRVLVRKFLLSGLYHNCIAFGLKEPRSCGAKASVQYSDKSGSMSAALCVAASLTVKIKELTLIGVLIETAQ